MTSMHTKHFTALAAGILFASVTPILAAPAAPEPAKETAAPREFTFDIPAQALTSALLAFSAQTGLQVLTSGPNVSTAKTDGVSGKLSIPTALDKLLNG